MSTSNHSSKLLTNQKIYTRKVPFRKFLIILSPLPGTSSDNADDALTFHDFRIMVRKSEIGPSGRGKSAFERNHSIAQIVIPTHRVTIVNIFISVRDVAAEDGLARCRLQRHHLGSGRVPSGLQKLQSRIKLDVSVD